MLLGCWDVWFLDEGSNESRWECGVYCLQSSLGWRWRRKQSCSVFLPHEKCHIISIFGSEDTALYPLKEGWERSMEALGVGLLIVVAFLSLTSVYLLRWVTHIPYYPALMALNIVFVFLFLQKVSLSIYFFIWLHWVLVVPCRVFCCGAQTL